MITEAEIEKSIEWLSGNGRNAAKCRAERETLDAYTKVLKATIMRENPSESLGAQEARAYADPRYLTHLKALEEAIFMDEGFRWKRSTEETRIEVWRTQSSNERALGKI
jgi:hypothetical protein